VLGDLFQITRGHAAGDVLAGEARGVELTQARIPALHRVDDPVERLEEESVGVDGPGDILLAAVERDELGHRRHVDAVDVLISHRGSRRGEVDPPGASIARLPDNLPGGGAAHDGVVHQQHVLALELEPDRVELAPHRARALRLPGHDEGALDVAVLDEALPILHPEVVGKREARGSAGLGDGDHDIDVVVGPFTENFLRERLSHPQARLVDRHVVDDGVRAREIDVLEDAWRIPGLLATLADVQLPVQSDDHRLARREVADELEPQGVERDALRRHHVLHTQRRLADSIAKRPDRAWVAERHHSVAEDQRHRRVAAETSPVDIGHRAENRVLVQCESALARQLAREEIEEDLGVRLRVHMPQLVAEYLLAKRPGVDQVAVVCQRDAVGRVDIEGLCLLRRFAPRRRVADVADADPATGRVHVVGLEDIAHQPVGLALVHLEIAGEHARGVLPAVLKRSEGVIQVLVYVSPTDDPDNAAHRCRTRWM